MSSIHVERRGNRYVLGNELIRLDFDLRTSDTMYNYVWVKSATTGEFERLYNFGCDVGARERGASTIRNSIGCASSSRSRCTPTRRR